MDAKITLSFDASIIDKAKEFAYKNNMSLSRLTEFLYSQLTHTNYQTLEDLPVANWVNMVAEGPVEYITKSKTNKKLQSTYYESRKKKS